MKNKIDSVMVDRLTAALSIIGINLDYDSVDNIIDVIEVMENNDGDISINDLLKIKKGEYIFKDRPCTGYKQDDDDKDEIIKNLLFGAYQEDLRRAYDKNISNGATVTIRVTPYDVSCDHDACTDSYHDYSRFKPF